MFWSIAPLVAACIVLAGMLGMCSFAARRPRPGPTPSYDAPAALQADADALDPHPAAGAARGVAVEFRSPSGIDGGRTDPSGQPARAVTSTVGYLAPSGMYLA